MNFLNPAVLFGLIATAIPIALHFLNLRKLKKIEFSTLSFLKELQKTKIRKIKLKQWLLLVLRTLIIIFLVMAFARPTVKNITMGNSSTAKTTAVIVIDNTFSMSVVTEKGSFLNHAKQIAKSLLNNFQEGDEVAVLSLADVSNEPLKPSTNFSFVKRTIDNISVTDVSGTINSAVVKAAQILYQSKNYNKEIYLLTDLQKNRMFDSPKELFSLAGMLNDKVRLYFFDMHDKQATNIGVDDLVSLNQIFEKDKTVGFSAKVKNYSDHSINNSVVSLSINGKKSAQQALNLGAGESKEISFETTLSDTGLIQISADLEDDDMNQDNKRYFSVYVPDKISLLLLYDNKDDVKFVNYAVQDPAGKLHITESNLNQISSVNLKNYDAVFIIGSERNTNCSNLEQFVSNGGKVVVMPGTSSTLSNFSILCKSLGVPAPVNTVGKQNSSFSFSQIDKVDFQNPLLTDLFEDKKNQNIESPEIYFYFKLVSGSQGRSIISMLDNSPFLGEYKHGNGKIFLFNSAPVLSCNDFPMKGSFAPLMNKLLLSCASKMKENSSFLAGQELAADISNKLYSQIKVIAPGGMAEMISTDSLPNKNYLSYSKTNSTGVYKFYSGDKLLDYFAVNHNPRESVTERTSDQEYDDYLKQISFEGKSIKLKSDDDFSKVIYESRFGTELWKYLIIVVLLLAITESIVARSSKKEAHPHTSQKEGF